jgi:hypothetical protein
VVTSLLTFVNFTGFTVVLDFMNLKTGFIKIRVPTKSIKIEIESLYGKFVVSN